jgi:hypothetical protein
MGNIEDGVEGRRSEDATAWDVVGVGFVVDEAVVRSEVVLDGDFYLTARVDRDVRSAEKEFKAGAQELCQQFHGLVLSGVWRILS